MTKQRMAMRSNFPWSDFKKLGTPELSSSSSTSTALSPKNFEKGRTLATELQVVFESQIHEEGEWLIDDCAKDQIESWTSHHASKSRDESAVPRTIICVMPCIDNVSHAPEFQTYLMRIAISYTEYLNPHQTAAVGSSDLPLYLSKRSSISMRNFIRELCPGVFYTYGEPMFLLTDRL